MTEETTTTARSSALLESTAVFEWMREQLFVGETVALPTTTKSEEDAIYVAKLQQLILNPIVDDSESINDFLIWIAHNSNLKIVEAPVPYSILPNAVLLDVRVQSRGPDDIVFDRNKDIRAKIARGNCILKRKSSSGGAYEYDMLVYALRKFTGGLGDEDDVEREDKNAWRKYFIKDYTDTRHVVSLEKANGEAAHMSCRWLNGAFVVCAGSKNVHLVFKTENDINNGPYDNERFAYAKVIALAVAKQLDRMDETLRNRFLSFLSWTRLTIIYEILIPTSQHVVDLSYLDEPLLKFITFTLNKVEEKQTSLCSMPPQLAIRIGELFQLSCVKEELVAVEQIDDYLVKVRKDQGYEGVVLYFLDADLNVIGLLKKKTVWYIVLRAIREKLRSFLSAKSERSQDIEKNIKARLVGIQSWIGFSDENRDQWTALGIKFAKWAAALQATTNKSDKNDMIAQFPVYWNRFLRETKTSDNIALTIV